MSGGRRLGGAGWPRAALALVLLAGATRAEAHTIMSTAGPFYGGIKHFFLSLDDALAALALGLLCGLRGEGPAWRALCTLPIAWLAAGATALWVALPSPATSAISAVSLLALGCLVAAGLRLRLPQFAALATAAGLLHGFLNGLSMRELGPRDALWQLLGVALAALVVVVYPAAVLDLAKRPWTRVVVRVLGSWIAAIGLLLLGWSLRPTP